MYYEPKKVRSYRLSDDVIEEMDRMRKNVRWGKRESAAAVIERVIREAAANRNTCPRSKEERENNG